MLSPHRVALRVIQHIHFAVRSIKAACSLVDERWSKYRKRKFIKNFAMIPFSIVESSSFMPQDLKIWVSVITTCYLLSFISNANLGEINRLAFSAKYQENVPCCGNSFGPPPPSAEMI
jgi:hypothetical protein